MKTKTNYRTARIVSRLFQEAIRKAAYSDVKGFMKLMIARDEVINSLGYYLTNKGKLIKTNGAAYKKEIRRLQNLVEETVGRP